MDLFNQIRPGQDQVLVAALVFVAAKIGGPETLGLQKGAHCAVQHQHALLQRRSKRSHSLPPLLAFLGGQAGLPTAAHRFFSPESKKMRKADAPCRSGTCRVTLRNPASLSEPSSRFGSNPRC